MIYRQQSINKTLPSANYTISDIDALISLCLKLHEVCHRDSLNAICKNEFSVKNIKNTDEQAVREFLKSDFLWAIEINGSEGEYLHIMDLESLGKIDLPYRIQKITIQNDSMYEFKNKSKPPIYFFVTIDFSTPYIFDLISSPSQSTKNASSYFISGTTSVTVKGFAAEFDLFFKKHTNLNYIVNIKNVYDFTLWTIFLPILLFYLTIHGKEMVPDSIANTPVLIQLIFSITLFFIILLFFRLVFNFGRWFFPCQELTSQSSLQRNVSKYIFSVVVAGVVGTIAYNLLSWIVGRLF